MAVTLKPISKQNIVVTGASSGIGLATAHRAAEAGAKVVLAARSEAPLREAVARIEAKGGEAIHVVADVARRGDVERVAQAAIERFGGFDTWVNNAGVGIWGRIDEVTEADKRQLFDINFWGMAHGSEIALKHLRKRGGALINVGSVASDYAIPVQGIYSASKQAVKGYTDALRMEIEAEGAAVSVTLVKPASIGTPMPQHVKNYTDAKPKSPPPVYRPEDVADAILRAAAHPTRDVVVGSAGRTMIGLNRIAPRLMDWIGRTFLTRVQMGKQPPSQGDNLHQGFAEGDVYGDHQGSAIRPSMTTRLAAHPRLALAVAGATAAGTGLFLWSRHKAGQERVPAAEQPEEQEVEAHPS
jgi:short-subunit dehydrogenase